MEQWKAVVELDQRIIDEAVPLWRDGLLVARGRARGGRGRRPSDYVFTVDDHLRANGIKFGNGFDRRSKLYAAYERAIRLAAKERYGIVTAVKSRPLNT